MNLLRKTFDEYSNDGASLIGAGLAFYGLLSLAPLAVLVIFLLTFVLGEQAARGEVADAMRGVLGETAARSLAAIIKGAMNGESKGTAWLIGFATLIWSSTRLFITLKEALNKIWNVAPAPGAFRVRIIRATIKRFFTLTLIVAIGLALIGSAALDAALHKLTPMLPMSNVFITVAESGALALILTVGMVILYRFLPDVSIRTFEVLPGAFFTAILLVGGKAALGFYLSSIAAESTYGVAGALIVVVLWLAYTSQIFLFGAEFTKVWVEDVGSGMTPDPGWMRVQIVQLAPERPDLPPMIVQGDLEEEE